MKIGLITFIGSAKPTANQLKFGSEVETTVSSIFMETSKYVSVFIPTDRDKLRAELVRLCDEERCSLVLTLGHTGLGPSDFAPDVTMEIVDRRLPGFGEIMRYYSYERFKVSVLSRAEAGVRGKTLVINLPAKPKPIKFCLRLLQEGIVEALYQVAGMKLVLRGDEVVIPIDKYLPFLKKFRPKLDPNGPVHPGF